MKLTYLLLLECFLDRFLRLLAWLVGGLFSFFVGKNGDLMPSFEPGDILEFAALVNFESLRGRYALIDLGASTHELLLWYSGLSVRIA